MRRRGDPSHRQPQRIRPEPLGDGRPVDGRFWAAPAGWGGDGSNGERGTRIEAILDNDRPLLCKIGVAGALLLACIAAPLVFLAAGLRPTTPTVAAEAPADAVQDDPMVDPLPAQAAVRLGTARYRYGSRIASMGVSADGKLAVVSCGVAWFSGLYWPARVFDLTDGRCLYSIPDEPGRVPRP